MGTYSIQPSVPEGILRKQKQQLLNLRETLSEFHTADTLVFSKNSTEITGFGFWCDILPVGIISSSCAAPVILHQRQIETSY